MRFLPPRSNFFAGAQDCARPTGRAIPAMCSMNLGSRFPGGTPGRICCSKRPTSSATGMYSRRPRSKLLSALAGRASVGRRSYLKPGFVSNATGSASLCLSSALVEGKVHAFPWARYSHKEAAPICLIARTKTVRPFSQAAKFGWMVTARFIRIFETSGSIMKRHYQASPA